MSQYSGDKPPALDRIHYMTLDQQARIIKLIEEIEAAETLPIPRIIMTMDDTYLWIRSKANNRYRSTALGISPVKALVEYMREQYKLLIGEPSGQKVAEEIGSVLPLAQERTYTIKGRSLESGLPAAVDVSSIEVRKALLERSFDDKFFEGLRFFINQIPLSQKVSHQELAQASIMVRHGLHNIKGLPELLQEVTGLNVILE